VLAVKISTLCEWNRFFDEKMNPVILPDRRGRSTRVTPEMVRRVMEAAKELKALGKRLRIKSFTRQMAARAVELSSKTMTEILIANDLYKVQIKKRRPLFYQSLRRTIPNGLVSADGKEFAVLIDDVVYKFNLELAVDVKTFHHSAFSIADTETTEEFLKVLEGHRESWGPPLGLVMDHKKANLSEEAQAYLVRHDIAMLPAGPANPKGNGAVESAFSGMEKVIGTIRLSSASPRELAKGILQKIAEVYIAMRNRLARLGTTEPPQVSIKIAASAQEREECKARYKERAKERARRKVAPGVTEKWERLHWLIEQHKLEVDEPSLERARKSIASYDLKAISQSEEAFLKAIRRDQRRSSLAYFFGILRNIQDGMDTARYQAYCEQRYNYKQMIERAKRDQEENTESTVDVLLKTLRVAISSPAGYLKEVTIRQAKRMALNLKKQHRYLGAFKTKVQEALAGIRDLTLTERNTMIGLVDQFLT
jgi:hypothetical protein